MTTITLTDGYAIHTETPCDDIVADAVNGEWLQLEDIKGIEYIINPDHIIAIERSAS